MNQAVFDFLSKTIPFQLLPLKEIERLVEKITVKHYAKDSILSVQDKTTLDQVYVVKSGSLELYHQKDGKKSVKGTIHQGEIFGGISILMNSGLSVRTVKTIEDSSLCLISKTLFLDICKQYNKFNDFFSKEFRNRMVDDSYASIISTSQALNFIKDLVPFSFLPREALEEVADSLSILRIPKNDIVFLQGQSKVDHLYIIQKGVAERYYEEDNNKNLRGLLGEGDMFGGISMLLNDMIAVRTLKTTEETFFYRLAQDRFFDLCQKHKIFSEYFTDTFGKRMLDRSYAAIITRDRGTKEAGPRFFNQPISNIVSNRLVSCDQDISIQDAAKIMSVEKCSSIFIKDRSETIIGVVTDNDLRNKVIAKGISTAKPISEIMSSPLNTISAQALVFEALISMMQMNIKHLAVTDARGKVFGVVTNHDLLKSQGQSPVFVIREIVMATGLNALIEKHKQMPILIHNLITNGAKAKNVNRFITTVSDMILKKIIGYALNELGEPPVKFAFMIMGSEGRKEQTLKTDQDNAIVYEDVPAEQKEEVNGYFLKFGEKVSDWLDQVGYDYCDGGIMAKNPKWCQSLSVWKQYFSKWIHAAKPENLLRSSIFFDFRGAYGHMELIHQLREFLFKSLVGWSGFFRHLTENALYFKPPIGFFRNFVVESKGEHRDSFDIKHAMMPVVDFARIHALNNRIEETNTLERLHQLFLRDVLSKTEYKEIDQAYSFLMQMRFMRQITAIEDGKKPDNYINPKKLSRIEQKMLKEIFKKIENMQTKLSFEFTGMP